MPYSQPPPLRDAPACHLAQLQHVHVIHILNTTITTTLLQGNTVCFTARNKGCEWVNSDCCAPTIDFDKLELGVRPKCVGRTGVGLGRWGDTWQYRAA